MKDKNAILQLSCQFFYQHGFHSSGVETLAANANISKRTLYKYFPSKEMLIEASLNYRHANFMQLLISFLADYDPTQTHIGYLEFLKRWLLSDNFFGCMFINACAEFSEQGNPFYQQAFFHKQQILQLLTQKFDKANLQNADALAKSLFLQGEGMIVAKQTGIIGDNIDEYTHLIHESLKALSNNNLP